jgi:hypothetical protein
MSDPITLLDRQAAELFASSRNNFGTTAWHESREGYLQALRDERRYKAGPIKSIEELKSERPKEKTPPVEVTGLENPALHMITETWGAP